MLEMARKGELLSVAAAGVLKDGRTVTMYGNATFDPVLLVGSLESTKLDIQHHFIEE